MAEVRVLSVCTHNRTRSVLVGGLLTYHFQRVGFPGQVRTAGFGDVDLPPTDQAMRLLTERGIAVGDHRSRRIDVADVADAALIVTAERQHVIDIAASWPEAFRKSFTLPELVMRADRMRGTPYASIAGWVDAVGAGRTPFAYLDGPDSDDIEDPTGASPAAWRRAITTIDELTAQLAGALTSQIVAAA